MTTRRAPRRDRALNTSRWISTALELILTKAVAASPLLPAARCSLRGWRNTVELVLFEISNSMKPYPSVFRTYTNKLRPIIGFWEPTNLDEVSNRIPPTSHYAIIYYTILYYAMLHYTIAPLSSRPGHDATAHKWAGDPPLSAACQSPTIGATQPGPTPSDYI